MEEIAAVPWNAEQKETFLRQQFNAQDRHYRQVYPDAEYCVLESGLDRIGRWYVWRGDWEYRIVDIALLPDWRGRGIGTALIMQLQREAEIAAKPATIHVEEFNPAQRLYNRLGFQRVKQNGIYWLMRWEKTVGSKATDLGRIDCRTGVKSERVPP